MDGVSAEASRMRAAERAATGARSAEAPLLAETAQNPHKASEDRWEHLLLATADEEDYLYAVQAKYPELMAQPT